jgi:hypothetical protein
MQSALERATHHRGSLEVNLGDTGKVTLELALLADDENRLVYRYKITDEDAGIDHEGPAQTPTTSPRRSWPPSP